MFMASGKESMPRHIFGSLIERDIFTMSGGDPVPDGAEANKDMVVRDNALAFSSPFPLPGAPQKKPRIQYAGLSFHMAAFRRDQGMKFISAVTDSENATNSLTAFSASPRSSISTGVCM